MAYVVSFENSGAGFFSMVEVAGDAPVAPEKLPLDVAYGSVLGIRDGMGFIVFLKDGGLSIEGCCSGDDPTTDIDFSRVVFRLMPWTRKTDAEP